MAIDIFQLYGPNRANAPTTGYPRGSLKNESVPGANDGTPLDNQWGNDIAGFLQSLLEETGLTPSGTPDQVGNSQYLEAVNKLNLYETEITFKIPTDYATLQEAIDDQMKIRRSGQGQIILEIEAGHQLTRGLNL